MSSSSSDWGDNATPRQRALYVSRARSPEGGVGRESKCGAGGVFFFFIICTPHLRKANVSDVRSCLNRADNLSIIFSNDRCICQRPCRCREDHSRGYVRHERVLVTYLQPGSVGVYTCMHATYTLSHSASPPRSVAHHQRGGKNTIRVQKVQEGRAEPRTPSLTLFSSSPNTGSVNGGGEAHTCLAP